MSKSRMEAFSDGVLAIVITIMVLEMKAPEHATRLADLRPVVPVFWSYVLSFVYLAIYWNNHHHLLQAASRVTARVMWANLHLLFWLSLIPFATAWVGENHPSSAPAAIYGSVLLLCAVAYWILEQCLLAVEGRESRLAVAVGSDVKGKVSAGLYAAAIALAFLSPWIAYAIFVAVAVMWLVPDPRIARVLDAQRQTAAPDHRAPDP